MGKLAVKNREQRAVELSSYALEAAEEFYKGEGVSLTERKAQENDGTMVTVVCLTYRHEPFIAEALESFLRQKTNFKFKVFVGEDKSPDNTADIVREYADCYPDIIVPFIREENMGAQRNLIDLCQRATSPYIAFCEGDDYWVDDYKLQKQFDYMESHPEKRACTTQTRILAPEDWHLRSWYRPMEDGELIIPNSIPGFSEKEEYTPSYIAGINVAHTSTHFYRWNYDLPVPDWYYEGIIGDTPLLLLQLGNTNLGVLPTITSVYRINEGSAFFDKNREANFLRTRLDYVRYLSGFAEFAREHYRGYPLTAVENRIKLESANYLSTLLKRDDMDTVTQFFADFPQAGALALQTYIGFYRDQRAMSGTFGWDGYKLIARNRVFRRSMKPVIRIGLKLNRTKGLIKGKVRNLMSWNLYWINTARKKEDDLWIFAGFNKRNYMDNSKYLYEYVLEHHPEIRAYWITLDKQIYEQLQEEGKPVLMMRTQECRSIVSRAAIGVTDHYRMSDFESFSGLNDHLKIVQLWHGVGLKAIGDLKNTSVPGVTYCDDILPADGEKGVALLKKKLKYIRHAYYRELFEHYFLLACPGPERVEQVAKPLHIPLEACMFSGHPRNVHLHLSAPDTDPRRILYAPTYRWSVNRERALVRQIKDYADEIQTRMERLDCELTLRLHPHTWRSYGHILDSIAEDHDRIVVDHEMDIYTTLGTYSIIVSDYSSIAYDFILLDRPVVFFNYDFEDYIQTECALNYDYDAYSPGTKTKTWMETLDAIEAYLRDPEKDGPWRRKVRDEFYDMSVNDAENSERIVQEIKTRLAAERNGENRK